jgi:hypothetical protein
VLTLESNAEVDSTAPAPRLSACTVLAAVARRSAPHLIEATVIPAVLFYSCLTFASTRVAIVSVLIWAYGAVVCRLAGRRAIPPILVLAVIGITVRTLIALASGSTFIYFFQPILGTVAMAGVFLLSLTFGRPMVARLASEFCPLAPEMADLPAVVRLFRGLTVLWAGVSLATAATTLGLLLSLPLGAFVVAKTISGLIITTGAIALTVSWSLRTARREDLVPSLTQACLLHSMVSTSTW